MLIENLFIRVVLDEGAQLPIRAHRTDAGLDLFSREHIVLWGGMSHTFDTGVHMEIPKGCYGEIASRSGLNINHGIVSCGGVIDEGYTGSICVKLYNLTGISYEVNVGDKIAQLILKPYVSETGFEVVQELGKTERGNNGFGSSGK